MLGTDRTRKVSSLFNLPAFALLVAELIIHHSVAQGHFCDARADGGGEAHSAEGAANLGVENVELVGFNICRGPMPPIDVEFFRRACPENVVVSTLGVCSVVGCQLDALALKRGMHALGIGARAKQGISHARCLVAGEVAEGLIIVSHGAP